MYNLNIIKHEGLLVQNLSQDLQKIENKADLTADELKKLAIGYAYLELVDKSVKYTKLYIKEVLDVNILYDSAFDNIRSSKEFAALEDKYIPRINIWVIFLFSCGLLGIFLSVVLNLRQKGDTVGNLLISSFVLFHSLFIIHGCFFMSRNNFNTPGVLYISTSFSFFYGPLLYFYFKRISEKYKFRTIDLLHLIPSAIIFLYLLPIYLLPGQDKLHMMFNREDDSFLAVIVITIAKFISLSVYAFLVYRIYAKIRKKKQKTDTQVLKWQRNIMVLNFVYVFSYFIFGIARIKVFDINISIYPQVFLMSFIILYVGYVAYVQPKVFSKKTLFKEIDILKYQKSGLTHSFSEELKTNLLMLLDEKKVFKQNNISLDILADQLGTTRHNISQVINEHFDMNFFHLINKYRIEEAKEILKNDHNRNLNIIDVAYDVGFNNKVTFNKAFKAETNMTPTDYLQYMELEVS